MIVKPENFDTDYPRLSRKDNIDHKIFIFDDLTDLFLPDTPVKLDLFIFAFCLSGSGKVCINLHEHEVNKGNIIAIFPDDVLKGYSVNTEFKALFVGVTADAMEDIITDLHTVIPFIISFRNMPITTISETRLIDLAQFHSFLWHKIRNAKGEFAKRAVGSLLQALLYDTLETFRESANIMQQKRKRSRNEELFFRLTALIERHYREERSVMFYAARLCITPKHLSAAVKKVSGKTAGEWIDRYVILSAKMMLRNSTHTIQEISNELHFANQSFFGKYFKEHVGISPSAYRMLLTGDMQK